MISVGFFSLRARDFGGAAWPGPGGPESTYRGRGARDAVRGLSLSGFVEASLTQGRGEPARAPMGWKRYGQGGGRRADAEPVTGDAHSN